MDELHSTVTTQPQAASSRPDATNQHSSKKSRAQRKKSLRRADLHKAQCESTVPSATREKESVPGSRKLWGTLRAATASVVSSTIGKLTTVGKHVEVKRNTNYDQMAQLTIEIVNGGSFLEEVKMY